MEDLKDLKRLNRAPSSYSDRGSNVVVVLLTPLTYFCPPPSSSSSSGGPCAGGRPRQRRPRPAPGLRPPSLLRPARSRPVNICRQAAASRVQRCTRELRVPRTPPAQSLSGPSARRGGASDLRRHGKFKAGTHVTTRGPR